jgi:DNA-binding XRE family transcriptional regulator
LLGAVTVTSATSAHARTGKHAGRCDAHLSKRLKMKNNGNVLVWEVEQTSSNTGEPVDVPYACLRPTGRSFAIGENEEDGAEYLGNVQTAYLGISGTLVGDVVTTGLAQKVSRLPTPSERQFESRAAGRLSQDSFALHAGMDHSYFGAIERGEVNVSLSTIVKIAQALDTKASALFALAGL